MQSKQKTYIAVLEEVSVIFSQVGWEGTQGQSMFHVHIRLFLDWSNKEDIEIQEK